MPECVIVKAGEEDIDRVANNLRPEHVREISQFSTLPPFRAVWHSVDDSLVVLAGKMDAVALFLAGAGRTRRREDVGTVWMLATAEVDLYPRAVAIAIKRLWGTAHRVAGVPVIEQFIPSWYGKGIRFLEWLGWERTDEDNPRRRRGMIRMIHKETR